MLRLCSLICTVVSKSSAEISTPIGAVLELRSHANLPCLVKLAPKPYPAFESDAYTSLIGNEAQWRAAQILLVTLNGIRLYAQTLPVDLLER